MFQDGSIESHFISQQYNCMPRQASSEGQVVYSASAIAHTRPCHDPSQHSTGTAIIPEASYPDSTVTKCWCQHLAHSTARYREHAISLGHPLIFKRFPFNNFTYFLTLFSKFFSSFPHGTCSLSVSRQYLALDGIYHPLWAAFPNNPTLWKCITKQLRHWPRRDSHPLWCTVPGDLDSCTPQRTLL